MIRNLLYARSCRVGKTKIEIVVPTVKQVLEDEEAYDSLISSILATPYEYMVQLYDLGIDFDAISSFDLFLMLFEGIKKADTSLVFGELDLSKFEYGVNKENNLPVLINTEQDIVIDKAVHYEICETIRQINHLKKTDKKPGNEEAKKYMIERARLKQKRAKNKPKKSQLEELIIALVNTEQFKYGYEGVLDLTIYQFNASVYQIIKKINYDNTMIGCYAGTISAKELNQDQLNWLTSK